MIKSMTSSRSYLLRALNEWIHDNGMTPHIVVDALQKDVIVPTEFVSSGKIVLNMSASAIHGLIIDNDFMSFSARFSGQAMDVIVPISAIMAIYAKENGQGMVFTDEGGHAAADTTESAASKAASLKSKPLKATPLKAATSISHSSESGKGVTPKTKVSERPSLKLVQ